MEFSELKIPGCYIITPLCHEDTRGRFFKTYHDPYYKAHGLPSSFKEEFVSISQRNVLRGMHFQLPPAAQNKLVYCLKGSVLDGFVDLRKGSPTYKQNLTVTLSSKNQKILFLPKGMAHGFFTLSREAIMVYKTSTVHSPQYDTGISWQRCGIDWPSENPILSDRDRTFPDLNSFESPFNYKI